jgi:hypothetical protein
MVLAAGFGKAVEPDSTATEAAVALLVAELGDDHFDARQQAAGRLADLASQPARREAMARAIRAALDRVDIPYETRRQLERLARELPPVKAKAPQQLSDDDLNRLMEQLDGDTYAERVGAAARLASFIERPAGACRVVERLRPLLRDPRLSRQTRERLQPIYDRAQMVWLSSEPRFWQWPAVSQEQIDHWLELLVRPLPPPTSDTSLQEGRARLERKRRLADREAAQAELLALLARDDQTARVKSALDARLAAGQMDEDARRRATELTDWTRPWLALEGWTERKMMSVAEVPVGMAYQGLKAPRATLFDRVDTQQAHCVSDTSLPPGNYPLGVFFPHPSFLRSDSQFVIFHLPTPRARLAYHYQLKANRDRRLPELSERTLARLAAEKRPMKQAELLMLPSLDQRAVSRFAGKYLLAVGDPPPPDKQQQERMGRGSPYASFCNLLVEIGRHEAAPGLLQAIQSGKLPKPTTKSPEDWPWIALLAILASDPGPDAERLLPGLVSRTDPLVLNSPAPSDVGATAAAILVDLRGIAVEKFGLEMADDPALAEFGGIGYRFNPPEMRQKVLDWWQRQKAVQTGNSR